MASPRKERLPRRGAEGEGSNDPAALHQECIRPKIIGPEGYRSMMDQDLFLISVGYRILEDYDFELPEPDLRINNPPLGRLGVYEEACEAGLRFPLLPFIVELLGSYKIPLYILTPNSIRHIVGSLGISFLAEMQPSLSLFCSLFTAQKHPYAKVW